MGALRARHLFCLLSAAACAGGSDHARREAVVASVDSAARSFEAAQRARDAVRTIAHLAPDFYMYNDGVRVGYDSVAASIRRTMGGLRHLEPGFENLEVRPLGPEAALVSLTFHDSIVTDSGKTLTFRGPTTLVWERRGRDWLIVYADADHYSTP